MNTIIWEKWKDPLDPFGVAKEEAEDESDPDFHAAVATFDDDDDDEEVDEPGRKRWGGPAVVSPVFGIVPIANDNKPGKLFNFWVGHANFDLSRAAVRKIEAVPGVETLDVVSRYRFRLGVGKAFRQADVKAAVERATCRPAAPAKVEELRKFLARRHAHWAILVDATGKCRAVTGASPADVSAKVKARPAAEVYTSWEN